MQSVICNEYDFQTRKCLSIEDNIAFPKFVALIDIPTLIFIWVFTFCGSRYLQSYLIHQDIDPA